MEKFKFTTRLLGILLSVCFIGCSSDDENTSLDSADQLIGKSFTTNTKTYSDIGEPSSDNEEIKFVSSTKCKIHTWGYWYNYYDDGSQERNSYDNPIETYSYNVSNSTITILNYYDDMETGSRNRTLQYAGGKIISGNTIFNESSSSSIEDDGDEEPEESSTLSTSSFLYKWYDAAEYSESLTYKRQGNTEKAESVLTHGIVFQNSASGYYWHKSGTKIINEPFTWSLGSGSTIKMNHPDCGNITIKILFQNVNDMKIITLICDELNSDGVEDFAR